MGARRLVLNGLTAEVRGGEAEGTGRAGRGAGSPDSLEFYHELELYRQLLALPPAPQEDTSPPEETRPRRRARTPDPQPSADKCDAVERRSRTPGCRAAAARLLPAHTRPAKYLGSFPVRGGEHAARASSVSKQLALLKENAQAIPVLLVIALTGVKVCDVPASSIRMSHALRRISYATCEAARALFALVAREPRAEPDEASVEHYCHAFQTDTPQQAEELNALVGDAFRMAFASQLQPSAPLWSKELTSECSMGVRAPDSLPGLKHHYPHCLERSQLQCDLGLSPLVDEPSPSSSDSSTSPTEGSGYRRLGERVGERIGEKLGERPPLMRRLARGLGGALLQADDDDSTPLVVDTPTTPTNGSICLSGHGGYINEAADARHDDMSRRHDDNHTHNDIDLHFRNCNNMKNSPSASHSHTTSSSSGASLSSHGSGNNNEPELRHAPWFQMGIPREIALEVLSSQPAGAFLVRGSSAARGTLALSVRVPREFSASGIAHYLILTTSKGYKIKGFTKEFSTLTALVTHHSVMPELLPTPLRLPRPPRAPHHHDLDSLNSPRHNLDSLNQTPRHDLETLNSRTPYQTPSRTPPVPPAPNRKTPHHVNKYLAQLDV